MGELSIRRNREIAAPRYQKMAKTEKQTSTSSVQTAKLAMPDKREATTVSETLRQLMSRVNQEERHTRDSRQTLQTGEAALAEVKDNLERMEELARQAAELPEADRSALQAELERLQGEISRIAQAGVKAGLFQSGGWEGLDALMEAALERLTSSQEGTQSLPSWLLGGMMAVTPDKDTLLDALGLDHDASIADVLAALENIPLENGTVSSYLASVYLGAVISNGIPTGEIDTVRAAQGLRQLLELVSQGVEPDKALALLTGGTFNSVAEFEAQFTDGTAPGLEYVLMDLLYSGVELPSSSSILGLLTGGDDMALLMDLLNVLDSGSGLMGLLDGAGASGDPLLAAQAQAAPDSAAANGSSSAEPAALAQIAVPVESREMGGVRVSGQDVSGADLDGKSETLTLTGRENVVLRGTTPAAAPEVRLAGSGTAVFQRLNAPVITAATPQAHMRVAGESETGQVFLEDHAVLTFEGGLLRAGEIHGGASSVLRLTGGAVEVLGTDVQALTVPVIIDGPASLWAASGMAVVQNPQGKTLNPFDVVWQTLLPEWTAITSLSVDGRQEKLALARGEHLRLWLLKEDTSQGYPAHSVILQGRDKAGHLKTRYVYLRWSQRARAFEEIAMYPNPFAVTGGEADQDWSYEEESHTLRIRSKRVSAISGGAGTDSNQLPFSGRIALDDEIGAVELTLNGVVCRVDTGRAFDLGRRNDVTLLLRGGTENIFESGAGYAGISLGDGTSLRIDRTKDSRGGPVGTLAATGGTGGAGIGRDSNAGQERTGVIQIRGGVVSAVGSGGGAGIGGALGAAVGDIQIQGGEVNAEADCCAAAIGAGIQGACGDIAITGAARVTKAKGGGPDGDIGGCMFGNCGKVQVAAGTDIGQAKLWTQKGLTLQMGDSSVTLPRFRVSAESLRLDVLNISTREAAQAAVVVLAADRRWVTRLQSVYGTMYGQMEQNASGLDSFRRYASVVRDNDEAGALLWDMREMLLQSPVSSYSRKGTEDVGYLLR